MTLLGADSLHIGGKRYMQRSGILGHVHQLVDFRLDSDSLRITLLRTSSTQYLLPTADIPNVRYRLSRCKILCATIRLFELTNMEESRNAGAEGKAANRSCSMPAFLTSRAGPCTARRQACRPHLRVWQFPTRRASRGCVEAGWYTHISIQALQKVTPSYR